MARLTWDDPANRVFETGIDRGVLYLTDGSGVPWNGLTAVNETPKDVDVEANFQDGRKYRSRGANGGFSATVEALTYPFQFEKYESTPGLVIGNQPKKPFGLSYRTLKKESEGLDSGYLLHVIYNAAAVATGIAFQSVDDTASPTKFTWSIEAKPSQLAGRRCAHLVIDTTIAHPWVVSSIEDILYGSDDVGPRLASSDEILEVFESGSIVRVIDNGDGSFTVSGPDEYVYWVSATEFEINYPTAIWLDEEEYILSSM